MKQQEASDLAHRLFDLCRSLPGVTEDVKWGNDLVFSVGGKMFAVFELPEGRPLSFKVSPGAFEVLTGQPGIRPAPYMAKHGWVSLETCEVLPSEMIEDLLQESHALVAAKLPRKLRRELGIA